MRRRPLLLFLAAGLAAGLTPGAADDCRHTEARDFDVDAAGATQVRIEATAGSLHVRGREGLERVEVRGTVCAESASDLDRVELEAYRRGDEVRVVARIDQGNSWHSSPWIDLTIEVPEGIDLDVSDGSGSTEIFNVGSLEIEDGSGELALERIEGDLRIEDGSGAIDVRDVSGLVVVERDGSGEITIRGARRDVEIHRDGSGGIDISDVGGSVRIGTDGSGSIRAENVTGDLVVDHDGSGGISFERIGGRVDLP
jgi:hypothetical protein